MHYTMTFLCIISYVTSIIADDSFVVPNIVHQVYDYKSPSFFFYLSLKCVQHYLKPARHMLWVNNEGRYRMGFWENWINSASAGSWEEDLKHLIQNNTIEVQFATFPSHPPGNTSLYVTQHAYRSDFIRMQALSMHGGIYLDTDAFVVKNMDIFRTSHFTFSLNNVVHEKNDPLSINNGVMTTSPNSSFIQLWMSKYSYYEGYSWDKHWFIPGLLAVKYPDYVNLEMTRISPISYGHQTASAAQYLTCGLYLPSSKAIWGPRYDEASQAYTYTSSQPNTYFYEMMMTKYVMHMTMSQERYICSLRKNLVSSAQIKNDLPSLLDDDKLKIWSDCRNMLGIQLIPEKDLIHSGYLAPDYHTVGKTIESKSYEYYVSEPSNPTATAIILFPDIFGWNGGRTRAIADMIAAAGYYVIVPKLMVPSLRGGSDGDGFPAVYDFAVDFVSYVSTITWEATLKPRIIEALNIIKSYHHQHHHDDGHQMMKIGALGFCYGGWVMCKAMSDGDMISSSHRVSFGAIAHPSITNIHKILYPSQEVKTLISSVSGPLLLLPAGNDPIDYRAGGIVYDTIKASYDDSISIEEFEEVQHGFLPRGDVTLPHVRGAVDNAMQHILSFYQQQFAK